MAKLIGAKPSDVDTNCFSPNMIHASVKHDPEIKVEIEYEDVEKQTIRSTPITLLD